jgi:hypothetical protein
MMSAPVGFFSRGGFSSSQWNSKKRVDYADVMESLYEIEPILHDFDLFSNQNKSKKYSRRTLCGVSS